MKIDKRKKIEKVASTDQSRWGINGVRLEGDRAIATDGTVLVCVKVGDSEKDIDGTIPTEAFKVARRVDKNTPARLKSEDLGMVVNGGVTIQGDRQRTHFDEHDHKFPNWKLVVPKEAGVLRIAINPLLLVKALEALGGQKGAGLVLEFQGKGEMDVTKQIKATLIRKIDDEDEAYIMPMRF